MTKLKEKFFFIFLIIFSLYLRNLHNEFYVFDGTDISSHILASLRLSSTYFFNFNSINENFFAQVAQFSHGFTGITFNWLVFELLFNFISIPINETNFIIIASLLSMICVTSLYLLFKTFIKKYKLNYLVFF